MPDARPHANPSLGATPAARPSDWLERRRALDPERSFLVQAPAGSGKTTLLTQRFLQLLGQAERPDEIVAITFTKAAAAEMRNRVLAALEAAATAAPEPAQNRADPPQDPEALNPNALAARALARAQKMGWQLLDLPSQLRITTIDAFCRSLAMQSPLSWGLLSGTGGQVDTQENPEQAYRLAARRTLHSLAEDSPLRPSVEALLLWRDNNWSDTENLIVHMLRQRNRWFQEFVFDRETDWQALRLRLEAPFRRNARSRLQTLSAIFHKLDSSVQSALELVRFAVRNGAKSELNALAERDQLPSDFAPAGHPFEAERLEDDAAIYRLLAGFLLTNDSQWKKKEGLNKHHGFPPTEQGRAAKDRFGKLVESLAIQPGLHAALAAVLHPIPIRYTPSEWELIRHCFAVLRHAAAHLQLVFAESGVADFTELAQIALRVLAPENGFASDFAQQQASAIRHLLVDEFQDTSRSQHQLLARLVAAWPQREGRTCFCVGDPMQSIYGFRDAEVELFERLKSHGLETAASDPDSPPFRFEFLQLRANFRTVPSLVEDLNARFAQIFPPGEDSVQFAPSSPARQSSSTARTELHLTFTQAGPEAANDPGPASEQASQAAQLQEIVALVTSKLAAARQPGLARFRIAILARARKSLLPIAAALQAAGIAFRAIKLVPLNQRPEVVDALMLARALLQPTDRTAWLAILRAPWCGLSLQQLHRLTSADDPALAATPVPTLLETRLPALLRADPEPTPVLQPPLDRRGYQAAERLRLVLSRAQAERSARHSTLGTWLAGVWRALGGADTVDRVQAENLRVLWAALDNLPDGESALLGPALTLALNNLYAAPDPAASDTFGVQLMTVHESKGLEFELVLVPDLQAKSQHGERALISWLERGLAEPGPNAELSEFLIAPIQTKGGESGQAKRWVDSVKLDRERLESQRLLYVAATRARDELHLFARPQFRLPTRPAAGPATSPEPVLAPPQGLLQTAWPALEQEVQAQFSTWLTAWQTSTQNQASGLPIANPAVANGAVFDLAAAAGADNLLQMPRPAPLAQPPARIRRLPDGYIAPQLPNWAPGAASAASGDPLGDSPIPALPAGLALPAVLANTPSPGNPFPRTEGSLPSRLLGSAIHTLLDQYSQLRNRMAAPQADLALNQALPPVLAQLRGGGLTPQVAQRLALEALAVVRRAAADPIGAWILAPHPHAANEVSITGYPGPLPADGSRRPPRHLRPDRLFFAPPPPPAQEVEPVWWIVDYKSGPGTSDPLNTPAERLAFLEAHRALYAPQLTAYAQILRGLRDQPHLPVHAGIFYPRIALWDSWKC